MGCFLFKCSMLGPDTHTHTHVILRTLLHTWHCPYVLHYNLAGCMKQSSVPMIWSETFRIFSGWIFIKWMRIKIYMKSFNWCLWLTVTSSCQWVYDQLACDGLHSNHPSETTPFQASLRLSFCPFCPWMLVYATHSNLWPCSDYSVDRSLWLRE